MGTLTYYFTSEKLPLLPIARVRISLKLETIVLVLTAALNTAQVSTAALYTSSQRGPSSTPRASVFAKKGRKVTRSNVSTNRLPIEVAYTLYAAKDLNLALNY